jgi:hypothetical protein
LDDLLRALVEPSQRMHELRQVSPSAGALTARQRWQILDEVKAAHAVAGEDLQSSET